MKIFIFEVFHYYLLLSNKFILFIVYLLNTNTAFISFNITLALVFNLSKQCGFAKC